MENPPFGSMIFPAINLPFSSGSSQLTHVWLPRVIFSLSLAREPHIDSMFHLNYPSVKHGKPGNPRNGHWNGKIINLTWKLLMIFPFQWPFQWPFRTFWLPEEEEKKKKVNFKTVFSGVSGWFLLKFLASHFCGCHSETMTEEESLGFSEDL